MTTGAFQSGHKCLSCKRDTYISPTVNGASTERGIVHGPSHLEDEVDEAVLDRLSPIDLNSSDPGGAIGHVDRGASVNTISGPLPLPRAGLLRIRYQSASSIMGVGSGRLSTS